MSFLSFIGLVQGTNYRKHLEFMFKPMVSRRCPLEPVESSDCFTQPQHPASNHKLPEETLIVKGLSSKLTDEAIKAAFSAYGQVNNVKIMDQYVAGPSWLVFFCLFPPSWVKIWGYVSSKLH